MGNYDEAVRQLKRQRLERLLTCPKCTAANRPGATIIELSEQDGWADCAVCAHHFRVDDGP